VVINGINIKRGVRELENKLMELDKIINDNKGE